MSPARRAAMGLLVAASAGCAFLAHRAMSHPDAPGPGMLVALVPLAALSAALARRLSPAVAVLALAALAAAAAWIGWGGFERHYMDLFFVEHAGMMLALAILFGRTVLPGAEPLCTRFARLVHGTVDARVVAYTRKLTITWAGLFGAIFAAACVLYATHRTEAWSFLANILTPGLIVSLFVVEYAVRRRVLPHEERVGILAAVHAFRRHMAGSQAPR